MLEPKPVGWKIRRRTFVRGTLATPLLALGAPAASAPNPVAPTLYLPKDRELRVLGTHVTLQEPLRRQAEADLGFRISFSPGGSAAVLHQASTRPESFDLYEQWSNSIRVLWQASAIQAIDKRRLKHWKHVNPLTKTGKLVPNARIGRGDAPHGLLHVQPDGSLGSDTRDAISFLPYVHNADSIGYDEAAAKPLLGDEPESWGWLFDPRLRGRTALVNAPTIGLFDAALAAQASGLMEFADIGSLTRDELDQLTAHLIRLKRQGQFRGVWSSVPQSVDYMRQDGVVVESMFSPGVAMLRGTGTRCIYAAPKEGYRAWHGVMCLSSATRGPTVDLAYAFMNWWLSGWPGAYIARQGYYISTPTLSRQHLTPEEWDYWYEGKPAAHDLKNTQGEVSIKRGEMRRGGSYERRFSNIAVWNTVMPTYEYSLIKWNEFLLA